MCCAAGDAHSNTVCRRTRAQVPTHRLGAPVPGQPRSRRGGKREWQRGREQGPTEDGPPEQAPTCRAAICRAATSSPATSSPATCSPAARAPSRVPSAPPGGCAQGTADTQRMHLMHLPIRCTCGSTCGGAGGGCAERPHLRRACAARACMVAAHVPAALQSLSLPAFLLPARACPPRRVGACRAR